MVLRLFAFDEILQGHIRTRKYNNCFQTFWLLQKLTLSLSHFSCSVNLFTCVQFYFITKLYFKLFYKSFSKFLTLYLNFILNSFTKLSVSFLLDNF